MPLDPGTKLGGYELRGELGLGSGATGEAYRAYDERSQRDVAIRVLPDEPSRDARAAAALGHPALPAMLDVGFDRGRHFLVTELLEGGTLGTLLDEGPLPLERALAYALQLLRGLAALHDQGIVHRELGPDTVFITRDGLVKILGLGGAGAVGSAGTPGYGAPEQIRGEPAGPRSDLFAFGALLYEMVSGSAAFGGTRAEARVAAVLHDEPSTLETRVGAIPRPVDKIFRRCLRKDPADRFRSAEEVIGALEAAIAAPEGRHRARSWVPVAVAATISLAVFAFGMRMLPRPEPAAASVRSVAVLPLENLDVDPARAGLADGITADVIAEISGVRGLQRVIAWNSVSRFRGTSRPLAEIAKTLEVDAVATGVFRTSGERVQVTVRLYERAYDRPMWANTFEGTGDNVIALERDIVRGLLERMRVGLTPQEQLRLSSRRAVDPEAYAERLRGRADCLEGTPAGLAQGLAHYQRAVEVDPGYASAWAGYADCYAVVGLSGLDRPQSVFPKAKAAALRAVALEASSAEALASLGQLRLLWDWDLEGAEKDVERAVALAPSSVPAHVQHVYVLITAGRFDEGVAEARRTQELDPLDFSAAFLVGWADISAGRFAEAIPALERAVELGPGAPFPHAQLAYAYARNGRRAEALAEFETATTLSPPGTVLLYDSWLAPLYALAGRSAEGLALADAWAKRAETAYVDGYSLAALYAALGEADKAVVWLRRACDDHSPNMVSLEHDEWFTALRADRRVAELIRRVRSPA